MLSRNNMQNKLFQEMLSLADSITDLDFVIDKINILSEDICLNYVEKINLNSERGKLTAEYDIKVVKSILEILHSYIIKASALSSSLPELSKNILEQQRKFIL